MRAFAPLLLALALGCATMPNTNALATRVDDIIEKSGAEVAVAYYDIASKQQFYRNERVVMHAASTMKVPVMLALMEAVTRGQLRLDQPVLVKNEFKSIFDGSTYSLEAREDGDPDLYDAVGSEKPLEELMRRMIVRSSNLATNILIEFVGAPKVMELMRALGANDIKVLRGVEDDKAYHAGMNNVATAYDLMLVMRAIGERKAISREASEVMIDILKAQEFNEKIPAGVPEGTVVAHKTGEITKISHDAAIVYPKTTAPYVLVVLTRGIEKGEDANRVIAAISGAVWKWRAE